MPSIRVIPILPGKLFEEAKLRAEIKSGLDRTGEKMRKKLDKTISGWSKAPSITYESKVADTAEVWCGPSGSEDMIEKWRRIDEGTDARDIVSGKGVMVFPFQGRGMSYVPKTTHRSFSSAPSWQKLGTDIVRTRRVKDHRIAAREWSEQLLDEEEPGFVNEMQAAIDRGLA